MPDDTPQPDATQDPEPHGVPTGRAMHIIYICAIAATVVGLYFGIRYQPVETSPIERAAPEQTHHTETPHPDAHAATFENNGGHADEMETSIMLHLRPDLVKLEQAGKGERVPFVVEGLDLPGVWTPRPWSRCHPDTGCGDPSRATTEKGERYTAAVVEALAQLIMGVSKAKPGDNPIPVKQAQAID